MIRNTDLSQKLITSEFYTLPPGTKFHRNPFPTFSYKHERLHDLGKQSKSKRSVLTDALCLEHASFGHSL